MCVCACACMCVCMYVCMSLDCDTWKKLIGYQASLQRSCNNEGFGTGGRRDDTNTCGNKATDNGDKHIKSMGFIFVQ